MQGNKEKYKFQSMGPDGYAESLGKLSNALVMPVMCKGTEWDVQYSLSSSYTWLRTAENSPSPAHP